MPRVLMIDPDQFFASICETSFARGGLELVHTLNGENIGEQIDRHAPDAVILAMALPRKSGFEVLEELRDDERTKALPIVVCTHAGTKEDVDRCFALGAREYLIKSQHSPEDLVRRIKKSILPL